MKKVCLAAFSYWVVCATLCCWLYPVTVFDSMARYAPMADAFARGDWALAFHPRFGVLFSSLTGSVVWLTGLAGDKACQIVSFFFLAFSALPVWALVKRLYNDERTAWIAVVLVWLATEYFVYAQDGLRDPARTLGLALCALAFVSRAGAPMALGLFVLVTLRTDLFLISGVILFAWWIYLIILRNKSLLSLFLPTSSFLLGAFLMCLMTHAYTGLWLPGAQLVGMYVKMTGGSL